MTHLDPNLGICFMFFLVLPSISFLSRDPELSSENLDGNPGKQGRFSESEASPGKA